ncbi:hypothetical protein SSX86_016781 [Deinandra increscens subsp. villosa]|uniref:Peptidase C14 caspase domain-containing protein n=1 Tax=Deinandra increscens subsp. villosa TaxID=3103831 RepID=A0AAP0GW03_9ASTR
MFLPQFLPPQLPTPTLSSSQLEPPPLPAKSENSSPSTTGGRLTPALTPATTSGEGHPSPSLRRAAPAAARHHHRRIEESKESYEKFTKEVTLVQDFAREMDSHPLPTKRNIQEALRWLVRENQPGDSLVFYFSGHDVWKPDFFDDEVDGFNESICTVDFRTSGARANGENGTCLDRIMYGLILLMHITWFTSMQKEAIQEQITRVLSKVDAAGSSKDGSM